MHWECLKREFYFITEVNTSLLKKVWKIEEKHFLRRPPKVFSQCAMYYCSNPMVHGEWVSLFFFHLTYDYFKDWWFLKYIHCLELKHKAKEATGNSGKRAGRGRVLARIAPACPFPRDKELFPQFSHFRGHGILRAVLGDTQATLFRHRLDRAGTGPKDTRTGGREVAATCHRTPRMSEHRIGINDHRRVPDLPVFEQNPETWIFNEIVSFLNIST